MSDFIPYGKQTITEKDINNINEVLKSEFLTQGPKVPEFEKAICKKVDANYGVASNSATSCLHLACLALGLRKGDYLWTSPITFAASANCSQYCGANVDFVDIDKETGLIDIDDLQNKLEIAKKEDKLPKVLIPVHLAGSSCDMEEIGFLSKKYGFKIIEDASHALGGKYKDFPVGSCKFSSITVFSFHPVKIITTGEGGIATTNDKELAQKMVDLRSHGIIKQDERFLFESEGDWYYEQQMLGFNYRLTDIAAALGISQISRLEKIVTERNALYINYKRLLSDLPVKLLKIPNNVYSSIHLAVIKINSDNKEMHKYIFKKLRENQIGVQLHYYPVHLHPYYRNLGFKKGDFPKSEIYKDKAMSLPLFPGLRYQQQEKVVDILTNSIRDFDEI